MVSGTVTQWQQPETFNLRAINGSSGPRHHSNCYFLSSMLQYGALDFFNLNKQHS